MQKSATYSHRLSIASQITPVLVAGTIVTLGASAAYGYLKVKQKGDGAPPAAAPSESRAAEHVVGTDSPATDGTIAGVTDGDAGAANTRSECSRVIPW